MYYIKLVVTAIYDSLEACYSSMTFAGGKRLLHVFYLCCVILLISLIALLLNIPVFVTWQEALTSCLILGAIVCVNFISRSRVEDVKSKFKTISSKIKRSKERDN